MMPTDDTASDDSFARQLREAVAMPDAPPQLLRAAIDLWDRRSGPAVTIARAMRQLRAVLSFDSAAAAPAMLATRSAGGPRHLLFSVAGRDIDLRVLPAPAGYTLAGQVLGPDESGRVDLRVSDSPTVIASAELSELGEFRIADVRPGRYELLLQLADDEVSFPVIDVGAGRT